MSAVAAALRLVIAAQSLLDLEDAIETHADEYRESLRLAIAFTIEALSGVLAACSLEGEHDEEPYIDFGPEPADARQAMLALPKYLERCRAELERAEGDGTVVLPATIMEIRGTTLAFLLQQRDD